MTRDGLTFTMVFLAESANYGEGIGNITTLKKMTIHWLPPFWKFI